ncbi:phosphotransferase enzyme family protein [Clostridium sp.]|uniref:phosphotransferase enzyme family protein n=1 Tax=Clostridium sp. TaxID=1506 RepID=UPI003464615F
MDREIEELFNEQILKDAARRFNIDISTLNLIGSSQNHVYEYKRQDKSYILRLTHSSHRSENLIKGELGLVLYLINNGISASKPIYSSSGDLSEKIHIGGSYFTATSFEKATGRKIGYPECISNTDLFEKCGRLTGEMHFLSKKYIPSSEEIKRLDWSHNHYLQNINKYISADQIKIFKSYKNIVNRINQLCKDSNSFGIIHGDINVGNFLLDDKDINIFDFDECQYSWFVEDIAIQLFYITYVFLDDSIDERQAQSCIFMKSFMDGYLKENYTDEYWLKQIPLFLQLRELIVYIGICRSTYFSNMSQWMKNYISQSKSRIEQGISIVSENYV